MNNEDGSRYKIKFFHYFKYITVEPTLVLYMMAFMTTNVVEQSFYVYKACSVNHGFNKTICDNLKDDKYKELTKEVQATTAKFHVWNSIAGHAVPVVLALFMGAWSDKRGRKLPLLIGLFGKLLFSFMIVINTLQTKWPLEYVIYTATLPSALTGADVAIFAAAFTYLVDVSSVKYRTIRLTILEVCYLATMPAGIALGAYLFGNVVNKSYTLMFVINTSLLVAAILYSMVRLEWRTNQKQKPLSEASNKFLDFFDSNHLTSTIQLLSKKRLKQKRTYLLLLILMMALYTFQRDEREVMFMYCQLVFNWGVKSYSMFKSVQSGLQDIILLIAIPLMSRILGWRDTVIIMIGASAHTIARVFYSTANVGYMFYIGGFFASFGPIVAPVIRSLVSKIVSSTEKGKAFSVLAVADNAVPLISGTLYSSIYHATIKSNPAAVYFLTMATQIGVFLITFYIHIKTEPYEFETEEEKREEIISDNDEDS